MCNILTSTSKIVFSHCTEIETYLLLFHSCPALFDFYIDQTLLTANNTFHYAIWFIFQNDCLLVLFRFWHHTQSTTQPVLHTSIRQCWRRILSTITPTQQCSSHTIDADNSYAWWLPIGPTVITIKHQCAKKKVDIFIYKDNFAPSFLKQFYLDHSNFRFTKTNSQINNLYLE